MREGLGGEDRLLIDPHPLSPDHTTSVDIADISADGKLLVYEIRRGGADETEIRLLDVDTGEDLADRYPTALYRDVTLVPDKSGFYYSLQDRKTGIRIRYHALGTDPRRRPGGLRRGLRPRPVDLAPWSRTAGATCSSR